MYPSYRGHYRIVYSTEPSGRVSGGIPLPYKMRILQRKGIRMKKTMVSRTTRPSMHASKPSARTSARGPKRTASPRKAPSSRTRPARNSMSRDTFTDSDIMSSRSAGINGFFDGGGGAAGALPAAQETAAAEAGNTRGIGSFLSGFGGIDGIISMMTKAQQMFKLFQQMGPIFKLISSFSGAKASTASVRSRRGRKTAYPIKGKR